MAAKKKTAVAKGKRTRRTKAPTRQLDTGARLHELIRRCAELRDSGQIAKARRLLTRVEKLQKALQAMEETLKRPGALAKSPK
jgi:hypothetical protein